MKRAALVASGLAVTALLAWLLFVALPRWYTRSGPAAGANASPAGAPDAQPVRKIKAHLFYVSDDGLRLTGIEQDVVYAEQTPEQAREIVLAQIAPPEAPLISAIPTGTSLRALFVTPDGQAFVDLSSEFVDAHPGGSLNELLTVYTIVHALTLNLPAIISVQLLVNGKEVETLAGHVDLRHPLFKNLPLTIGN
ncbi:MAG: GerMN domain-containing protein [Acidobacteriaceae bacterium]|jgi:spore germination protein GerM|nr:GerMN domain-containing protein [Acidobacteriaceae bacterium]